GCRRATSRAPGAATARPLFAISLLASFPPPASGASGHLAGAEQVLAAGLPEWFGYMHGWFRFPSRAAGAGPGLGVLADSITGGVPGGAWRAGRHGHGPGQLPGGAGAGLGTGTGCGGGPGKCGPRPPANATTTASSTHSAAAASPVSSSPTITCPA